MCVMHVCSYLNVDMYTPWYVCGGHRTTLGFDLPLLTCLKQGLSVTTVNTRPVGQVPIQGLWYLCLHLAVGALKVQVCFALSNFM